MTENRVRIRTHAGDVREVVLTWLGHWLDLSDREAWVPLGGGLWVKDIDRSHWARELRGLS